MRYPRVRRRLPRWLHRHILFFEACIEDAVEALARDLTGPARVLDAGAGETVYKRFFEKHHYVGIDLAIGEPDWDYLKLDVIGDLVSLPFPGGCFDACINIVTLEHVREPAAVLAEVARVLKPGGRLLLVVPQDWQVHQAPHDYYRFTRYGLRYLLEKSGFHRVKVRPCGGYFRLLSRRLLDGLRYFRGIWFVPAALLLAPPALVLPWFERLDRDRDFTLGYICTAVKP